MINRQSLEESNLKKDLYLEIGLKDIGLPRYKTEVGMKYRFGWKRSEMIHYYTEFLGMKDTITEEDLLGVNEKTELERKLAKSEKARVMTEEKVEMMNKMMIELQREVKGIKSGIQTL